MIRISRLSLLSLALLAAASVLQAQTFPVPQGYVNDYAGVTTAQERTQIETICRELETKTGAQIAVAVFPNLGGEDYTDYTVRLFEHWKIGKKGKDNGILILNAIAERKVRIEVGYGLEGIIPDGLAGRILRESMFPLLKEDKYAAAYLSGVIRIAALIARDAGVRLSSLEGLQVPRPESRPSPRTPFPFWIFFLLALFPLLGSRRGRHHRGLSPIFFGPWTGGGFGGSGFSGGGFGGFGGGCSGGGGAGGGY